MNKKRIEFLKKLKEHGVKENIPNVSKSTGELLHFLIKMNKCKKGLEIGCANGYSTIFLADAFEENNGKLVCYDVSEPSFKEAISNIKECDLENIVDFRFGDAKELLKDSDELFDFIFIDARKAHYHLFWEVVKPLMDNNALVIVDDVLKFTEKTEPFNKLIENESDFENVIIPVDGDDGIMLIRRVY